jgi:beta-glucosidase
MKPTLTRRAFGRLLGVFTAGAAASPAALAQSPTAMVPSRLEDAGSAFPNGFLWGAATASYQVEGAVHEAGRGPSIWDTFSHTPGNVAQGDTGDVADDTFHRYRDDIRLAADIGVRAMRLSVAWSRIFPTGSGVPNPRGLDFYRALVTELQAHGITPFVTLYHWDLPQALQDRGGWENIETAHRLSDYCGYVAGQLSAEGVNYFMTSNEIRTYVELGYGNGTHAPGLQVGRKRLAQLSHYALLGHGLSVQAIRARARSGTCVGLAENPIAIVPATLSSEDLEAAKCAMREENAPYLTAICEGRYTDQYLQGLGADAPHFTPEEMRTIATPLDMLGLNVYTPTYVRAAASTKGYEVLPSPTDFPHMASSWLTVGPESLFWATHLTYELWQPKAIYITENGCSTDDTLTNKGEVLDTGRVMYLRNYLAQLRRAVAGGAPVKGYFAWSLLDNFEWADGYGKRFGLIYVDFTTQKRTPKLSAQFYASVVSSNGRNLS